MLSTLLGMVIETRLVQPENVSSPNFVTVLGIVIEVRPMQLENAELPMAVTDGGKAENGKPAIMVLVAVSMMALQFSRLS